MLRAGKVDQVSEIIALSIYNLGETSLAEGAIGNIRGERSVPLRWKDQRGCC